MRQIANQVIIAMGLIIMILLALLVLLNRQKAEPEIQESEQQEKVMYEIPKSTASEDKITKKISPSLYQRLGDIFILKGF